MKKDEKLKDLFIEDLGTVTGGKGGPYTTLAIGEEDSTTTKPWYEEDIATTLALGEEGDGTVL